ncbi:MAG: SDR family oxidoreductase [Chitinophagaceae bacterium]
MIPKKHCVITGATGGIGFATAQMLARLGYSVTIVARNDMKGTNTVKMLQQQSENPDIDFVVANLASQNDIREAASTILQIHPVIDVLINNAGAWYSQFGLTEDGVERMFAVNHLSYFLLTHCLIKGLAKSPASRVINVSSYSHFNGKIYWDDLNLTKSYDGLKAYAQSKLANVFFTYEFVRRNPGLNIAINALHPGLVKTDIGIKHTYFFHSLAWRLRRLGGVSPEKGAATSIYLATSPDVEGMTGKYWDKRKPKRSSPTSYNTSDAARLWSICKKLCAIEDYYSYNS